MSILEFKNARVNNQLPAALLIKQTLDFNQGALNSTGALCINTGKFTGRSPKDKFIVKDAATQKTVDWENEFNHELAPEKFAKLKNDVLNYLDKKNELWLRKCYACAHPDYQISLNVLNEYPSGNLFAYNMFLRPEDREKNSAISEWTIIQAPDFRANPIVHGTRSENFSVISFTDKTILIGGTGYTGEIKKGVFSVLNYLLPTLFKVLSMHCSANVGDNKDVALFFGLSGTGKTTLSTDENRKLIGDDEHGWDEDSVFNFEGGCYAKVIGLNQEFEPEIFDAIKEGALVENVVFKQSNNVIDFNNRTITENTRVSYPINFIKNSLNSSRAGLPTTIFFLTCDASGVFPPVSKLSVSQAKYYFLSGYTSKIAGTETGITEPNPTFSACFGAPFLPLHPTVYAELLGEKLQDHKINVWLINTGWSGHSYLKGDRISIYHTRSIINAALNGHLDDDEFDIFPIFNLNIPKKCPNVPNDILNPLNKVENKAEFMAEIESLSKKFDDNFLKFKNQVSDDILICAPDVVIQ
jgi:phosphoenolpyruvate carboxykinase (ATP)